MHCQNIETTTMLDNGNSWWKPWKLSFFNSMKGQKKKQLERAKQVAAEANARRKVNKSWTQEERRRRYKQAAIAQACAKATALIATECFDGIILQLNDRNESKSYSSRKRILRRVIEKRQAQSVHRTIGRTCNRFANHMTIRSVSKSVGDLHRLSFYV